MSDWKARAERAEAALAKVNEIRNSIVGAQAVNWSEHVYPLVAALDAAGLEGLGYEEARRSVGTALERAQRAEAQLAALREAVMTLEWGTAARACSDLAASAREHETRIRAKALREAADSMDANGQDLVWDAFFRQGFAEQVTTWLRALADEAERGTR